MSRPADYVIRVLGGVRSTARLLKRNPSNVARWRMSKAKRGTGGQIPRAVHSRILKIAQERSLDITATDIILGRD